MTQTYRLGLATVDVQDGYTHTRFDSGDEVGAVWSVQPGQGETARQYGLEAVQMNRDHDLMHSTLARMLGMPGSPALYACATGRSMNPEHAAREEAAVLALQAWLAVLGLSVQELARRYAE